MKNLKQIFKKNIQAKYFYTCIIVFMMLISVSAAISGPQEDVNTSEQGVTTPENNTAADNPLPEKDIVEPISDTTEAVDSTVLPPVPNREPAGPATTMAWIYPGEPACGAVKEFTDGRLIDYLKPEYFLIGEGGELLFLTEEDYGCNGFSQANIETIKAFSTYQFATIASASTENMKAFLEQDKQTNIHTDKLVNFTLEHNITGIEIDFEDFGNWDEEVYESYKEFIDRLGSALQKEKKKLMVDGPATINTTQELWYQWRYEDFNALPVDYMVVMAYDYQYDQGTGAPVAPLDWAVAAAYWAEQRFTGGQVVVGIPSYGYSGRTNGRQLDLLTYEQAVTSEGFENALREESSAEMTWTNGNFFYTYQDQQSLDTKKSYIENAGFGYVSVWHLGGNLWFSK